MGASAELLGSRTSVLSASVRRAGRVYAAGANEFFEQLVTRMAKRVQLPISPPDTTVYPDEIAYDASATVRVQRLRTWPEGIETEIAIESPPVRTEAPLWVALRRLRPFAYAERPSLETPPRRSRFGVSQPEFVRVYEMHHREIHRDVGDAGNSYTRHTVTGRYWLPQPGTSDTLFCWLVWPAERITDAIFPLPIERWIQESPKTPPDD